MEFNLFVQFIQTIKIVSNQNVQLQLQELENSEPMRIVFVKVDLFHEFAVDF